MRDRDGTGGAREARPPLPLMAKKRNRGKTAVVSRPAAAAAAPAPARPVRRTQPLWRWRTFPVFFAFVAGALVASLVNPPSNTAGYVVQLGALGGFGYGLAHLFVTNVIVAGRLKRQRAAAERGEDPPEAFEEELVYPDDARAEKPAPRNAASSDD